MNSFRNKRLRHENIQVTTDEDEVSVVVKGLTVVVDNMYPFTAPTVMYKGDEGIVYLKAKYKEVKPFLNYYNIDIPCIYCNNYTCSWVPTYRIMHLVDEWHDYMRTFHWLDAYKAVIPLTPFDDLVHQRILSYVFHVSSHDGHRYAYLS
jgi:hypothetical protein